MKAEDLIGRKISLPDIRGALNQAHERGGWGPTNMYASQAGASFSFNGKLFRHYAGTVHGHERRIRSLYFPAAYTGRVATAIRESGFEVTASDLSDHWSAQLKSLGLGGDRRSFEDFPDREFDAVVVFEPYCIPAQLEYLAILASLSRDVPYIDIRQYAADIQWFAGMLGKPGMTMEEARAFCATFMEALGQGRMVRHGRAARGWEHGEYDARVMEHFIMDGGSVLRFRSVVPCGGSSPMAKLDLGIMDIQKEWDCHNAISLSLLADRLGSVVDLVAAGLERMRRVASCWMVFEGATPVSREFTIIG